MQVKLIQTLVPLVYLTCSPLALAADPSADEATIRQNAEQYVESFNARDAQRLAAFWSPEAVYMNPLTGDEVVGRPAIEEQFAGIFKDAGEAKFEVDIESIEFVSPNVGIERGIARVNRPDAEPEESTYTAVHVKRDGAWLLDRVSELDAATGEPAPPPSSYEHLKELEWMLGSWIDEDEGTTIQTDCEWTKNRNFMTRAFAVVIGDQVDSSGMQIIGWDPAAKQIRSWVFDSDGGFSEGKWRRKDNRWLIQQVGVLPDGGNSTATHIITFVNDDAFTWQSIDRTVDGEVLPNVAEVLVERQPPEEAAAGE